MEADTLRGVAPREARDDPASDAQRLQLHQSNERTLLAWIRTGIALMAFGFAIARFGFFLRQLVSLDHAPEAAEESTSTAWVGAALVALGVLAHLVATVRYARSRRAISRGDFGGSRAGTVIAFGAIATLVGAGMTVLLVLALND